MSWGLKPLGELCDVLDRKRKPITKKDRIEGEYPYYGATGILSYVENYIFDERLVLIGEDGAKWGAGENTAFAVEGKYWVNNHAHVIRPHRDTVLDQWIIYYLNAMDLSPFITGLTVPKLNQEKMRSITLPVPPIPEQKRIVAILDKAFAGIDQAIANTEKNLASARELFESTLNTIFTQKGEGWVTEELNKNVKFIDYRGKTPPKTEEGIRLITAKNVKMGFINREPEEFIDANVYDTWMTRGFPKKGDVLFTTEAPLGMIAQLDTDETVVIGQRLITMQADPVVLDHKFLKYMLMSKPLQEEIRSRGTGATVLGIKAKLLKLIPIFFPKKITQQKKIADKIELLENNCKELEVISRKKIASLNELKQSLLQKAFSGELTADETLAEAAE